MAALPSSRWLLLCLIAAGCSDGEREARRKALGPQPSFETLMVNADPEAGARAFGACAACHTIGKGGANRAGPNLHAIMGKPVAANLAFGYSYALKSVGGIWTPERVDAWLAAPATFAPRTSMAYPGMRDPLMRADLISYLQTQDDNTKVADKGHYHTTLSRKPVNY
jgi:cytochrome c